MLAAESEAEVQLKPFVTGVPVASTSWIVVPSQKVNLPEPIAVSDVMRKRAFTGVELYQHTLRPFGFPDTAKLFLPTLPGDARFFFFDRTRWGLTSRERSLLNLLRPHLALHREKWRQRSSTYCWLTWPVQRVDVGALRRGMPLARCGRARAGREGKRGRVVCCRSQIPAAAS